MTETHPNATLTVESIQIGHSKPSAAGSLNSTGIDKRAVERAEVLVDGLCGDTIVDTQNHGGPDQAV